MPAKIIVTSGTAINVTESATNIYNKMADLQTFVNGTMLGPAQTPIRIWKSQVVAVFELPPPPQG